MKLQRILSHDCKHELTISLYIMRTKQIYCLPADFLPLGLIGSEQKEARISMSNKQFLCLHFTDWSVGIINNNFIKNIYIGRHEKWIKYSVASITSINKTKHGEPLKEQIKTKQQWNRKKKYEVLASKNERLRSVRELQKISLE